MPLTKQCHLAADRRAFFQAAGAAALAGFLPDSPFVAEMQNDYPQLERLRAEHEKRGIIPPEKTYRTMEWSLHFPPQGKFEFNLEEAMKLARDAGSESMLFYSQDHWGYALYPSDRGVRHPNLTFDFFGKQVELAHQQGLSAAAYYSLQFNNQIVLSHPDWGWVNEEGELQRIRWYVPCLDSPYRQYVLGMMDEIFSRYDVQELFLDIFGIQFVVFHSEGRDPFCYCKYTQEAWEKEHPGDPYREGFKAPDGWEQRYAWHQKRSMVYMLDEIIVTARKHRPTLAISLNGGPESFPGDVLEKVDFIYAEPLPCESGISLGSIMMRGWGRPRYQAGIFTWAPYVDSVPERPFRVETDALILQNSRVFFVGETPLVAHIDGKGFATRWFVRAKEAFADVRNVDCLLDGIEPVPSSAMLYSELTRQECDARKRPLDFRRSTLGALELMTYSGRPVESIPEFRLTPDLLARFDTLVLPEVEVLTGAAVDAIRNWVKEGGILVASHRCGLLDENHKARTNFPLADVLGIDFASEERKYAIDEGGKPRPVTISTYLESVGNPLAQIFGPATLGLPGTFVNVRRTTATEVMRYRLPFMVEDLPHNEWYNWGPPPPGATLGGTSVAHNRYGNGQSVYIGAPVFRAMKDKLHWIRQWIPDLLRKLKPDPIAELRVSPFSRYVHGTFFYDKSRRFVLVQVLHTVELATQGEGCPAPKVSIVANPRKLNVTGARVVWPMTQDLPVGNRGDMIYVSLPEPNPYLALYLKLA
ncbi:MAG TPA: alpha-amylase family protein [Terriglobia bacterium]|nr:alpha-amylase family protein [Terriglobia bacterium]